jgi:hypothetical protein
VSGELAVATADPRRERSGKARTAGDVARAAARRAALEDVWKVLTNLPFEVRRTPDDALHVGAT